MDEELEAVAFVGTTLAPFFLNDPKKGEAGASFAAMAQLNPAQAAGEWPFADAEEAAADFALMVEGLAGGADAEDLVWEYRRLFTGPGHLVAPPWGSVYTDVESVVFGASTLELRAFMRKAGVARVSDERTPEDHIGLMLAMMAYLAQNKPEFLDEVPLTATCSPGRPTTWIRWSARRSTLSTEGLPRLTRSTLEGIRAARGLQVRDFPRFYR